MLPEVIENLIHSYLHIPMCFRDIEESAVLWYDDERQMGWFTKHGDAYNLFFCCSVLPYPCRGELISHTGHITRQDFETVWSIHNGDWPN